MNEKVTYSHSIPFGRSDSVGVDVLQQRQERMRPLLWSMKVWGVLFLGYIVVGLFASLVFNESIWQHPAMRGCLGLALSGTGTSMLLWRKQYAMLVHRAARLGRIATNPSKQERKITEPHHLRTQYLLTFVGGCGFISAGLILLYLAGMTFG